MRNITLQNSIHRDKLRFAHFSNASEVAIWPKAGRTGSELPNTAPGACLVDVILLELSDVNSNVLSRLVTFLHQLLEVFHFVDDFDLQPTQQLDFRSRT